MLRAAVVEPSKPRREITLEGLKKLNLEIQGIGFSNEFDLLEAMDEEPTAFDILILNTTIHNEGDGIELADYIRKRNGKIMICFLTESELYYAEAFSVLASGYLKYPLQVSELYNIINFFYQMPHIEKRASWMIKEKNGAYKRIFCRNIIYVESSNREIAIHMEDGTTIISYSKLDAAEEQLPSRQFLRCHQSYIINLHFVDQMSRNEFEIKGCAIPISRKYQLEAKNAYYDYMFSKM